jgi:nitroreductase
LVKQKIVFLTMTETLHPSKETPTTHPVADFIRRRWSPRAFSARSVSQFDLNTLFEAASWAASSINEQPWQFVYAHRADKAAFETLLSCLMPGNQSWAKNAAVLVLVLAQKQFAANRRPNRHALHDAGAATANLLLQGATLGIQGHVMGGFDHPKTTETLRLPDDVELVSFIALGYPGDPDSLDEPLRARELAPRHRKPLDAFVTEYRP